MRERIRLVKNYYEPSRAYEISPEHIPDKYRDPIPFLDMATRVYCEVNCYKLVIAVVKKLDDGLREHKLEANVIHLYKKQLDLSEKEFIDLDMDVFFEHCSEKEFKYYVVFYHHIMNYTQKNSQIKSLLYLTENTVWKGDIICNENNWIINEEK